MSFQIQMNSALIIRMKMFLLWNDEDEAIQL